jgi:site-specific recombinase XerC
VQEIPDRDTPQGCRNYAILALKAYTGARDIELQRADLADLRTQGGRLVLCAQGKGREQKNELLVIAHPEAEESITAWLVARGEQPGALIVSLSNNGFDERLTLRSVRQACAARARLATRCATPPSPAPSATAPR